MAKEVSVAVKIGAVLYFAWGIFHLWVAGEWVKALAQGTKSKLDLAIGPFTTFFLSVSQNIHIRITLFI